MNNLEGRMFSRLASRKIPEALLPSRLQSFFNVALLSVLALSGCGEDAKPEETSVPRIEVLGYKLGGDFTKPSQLKYTVFTPIPNLPSKICFSFFQPNGLPIGNQQCQSISEENVVPVTDFDESNTQNDGFDTTPANGQTIEGITDTPLNVDGDVKPIVGFVGGNARVNPEGTIEVDAGGSITTFRSCVGDTVTLHPGGAVEEKDGFVVLPIQRTSDSTEFNDFADRDASEVIKDKFSSQEATFLDGKPCSAYVVGAGQEEVTGETAETTQESGQ